MGWYIESTLCNRFLNWHTIFKKIKQLLTKLCPLWYVHFVLTILFVLKLASNMVVLHESNAFSILMPSTNKLYCSFFFKRFLFPRISVSKLKYWKRSKIPLILTWKQSDLSNGGLFWKSLVPLFRRTYALSVGFKMEPLRKNVFQC